MIIFMQFIFWLSPFVLPFPLALLAVVASGLWLIKHGGKRNGRKHAVPKHS